MQTTGQLARMLAPTVAETRPQHGVRSLGLIAQRLVVPPRAAVPVPRIPWSGVGGVAWYRGLAALALVSAAAELTVGAIFGAGQQIMASIFVTAFAVVALIAGAWRGRGARSGPAVLVGASVLGLAIVVSIVFEDSVAAILLPTVAFALTLPSLGRRSVWLFGALATATGVIVALLHAGVGTDGPLSLGLIVAAVAGALVEGVVIMAVLIIQRRELANLVTRYTSIVEQVPMGLFRLDPAGRVIDANHWFADMLGEPAVDDLVGSLLADRVVDPAHASALLDDVDRDVLTEEVQLRRRDGTVTWFRIRIRAVHDADGRLTWFQGAARDSTDEHESIAHTARLAAAIEQAAESVVITDPTGTVVYVNPAFEATTGFSPDEVIGRNHRQLYDAEQSSAFYQALLSTLASGRTWRGEIVNHRKNSGLLIEDVTVSPVLAADGTISNYVAVTRDVTAEHEAAERQQRLEVLQRERTRMIQSIAELRLGDAPHTAADAITAAILRLDGIVGAAVIRFDADGGASVLSIEGPSPLGLRAGDRLPAVRAELLRARAAAGPWHQPLEPGLEAYYGPGLNDIGIEALAFAPIGTGPNVIGTLVLATSDDDSARDLRDHLAVLVDLASAARMVLADAWHAEQTMAESRSRIGRVIADRAFEPVFQPVVDLATGDTVGFEALTRFRTGDRPDLVFAEARTAGLGPDLEEATLRATLDAAAALPEGCWLSLNVSPAMLLQPDRVTSILSARTRPLVVEVTEHDLIEDYGALREAFVAIGADVRLAVDDAGAGVANFSHIVELRPDIVKIDIGLIRGINADLSRQALVVGLHHFARASNRHVIAEGIETEAELATLLRLDVRYGQGFLLGRPAAASTWSEPRSVAHGRRRTGRRTPPREGRRGRTGQPSARIPA